MYKLYFITILLLLMSGTIAYGQSSPTFNGSGATAEISNLAVTFGPSQDEISYVVIVNTNSLSNTDPGTETDTVSIYYKYFGRNGVMISESHSTVSSIIDDVIPPVFTGNRTFPYAPNLKSYPPGTVSIGYGYIVNISASSTNTTNSNAWSVSGSLASIGRVIQLHTINPNVVD